MGTSFNEKNLSQVANVLTLEDLLEKGYDLTVHCNCCGKQQSLETEAYIEKLGRAFPLHRIASILDRQEMQTCNPAETVLQVTPR